MARKRQGSSPEPSEEVVVDPGDEAVESPVASPGDAVVSGMGGGEEEFADSGENAGGESPGGGSPGGGFVSRLTDLGFENIENEADAQERLLQSYSQLQAEAATLEREREQLRQLADYGRQYLDSLQKPAAEPTKAAGHELLGAPPAGWWAPPKFERGWLDKYQETDPETGKTKWRDGTPASVRASAEEYEAYINDWAVRLTTNPAEALRPLEEQIYQNVSRLIQEKYDGLRREEREEEFYERVKAENEWIYERDPRTNQIDRERFSPRGRRLVEVMTRLENSGVKDSREQFALAKELLGNEFGEEQPTPQTIAARAAADKKRQEHLRRATRTPSRSASVPSPEQAEPKQTRNVHNTAGHDLLDELAAAGVSL